MDELKIEYLPIKSLTPYERNARHHEDADIDAICASIKEFAFDDPVGVWGENNTIVEGHGRVLAAKKLGMKEVPCIRLDHLTEEQRRAYALAHNKTAELSAWDFSALEVELGGIFDIQMDDFGFENDNDRNQLGYMNDLMVDGTENSKQGRLEKDFFSVSFAFPIEEQDKILKYIADNGKDEIVDLIIREVINAD